MTDYTNPTTGTRFIHDDNGELVRMEKLCECCDKYFSIYPEDKVEFICPVCMRRTA